jgi:cupin fold WbuC family metalloprotein
MVEIIGFVTGELLAIYQRYEDIKGGLSFLTPNSSYIQVCTWKYNKEKYFTIHKHIDNIREVKKTQETIVVLDGSLKVTIWDENDSPVEIILKEKDFIILLAGWHTFQCLTDNTKILEVKNGPFISVEKDKVIA